MHLIAVVTKNDFARVFDELTPLRIDLGSGRVIAFETPKTVDLIRGSGLRVRGDAQVTWEALGISIPMTVRAWQILLVPSMVARGDDHVLAFDPKLEELDLKSIPNMVGSRIADAVNEALASERGKLAWNISRTLSWQRMLGPRFAPTRNFHLKPSRGEVEVTAEEFRLTIHFDAGLSLVDSATTHVSVAPKNMI